MVIFIIFNEFFFASCEYNNFRCNAHINYIFCTSYQSDIITELKDKKQNEFLNEQIYDFFISLFEDNINSEILIKYIENPIIIDNEEFKIKLLSFFENIFIKRIQKFETDKIPENEYQPFKQIIIKFCKTYFNNNSFENTFIILFEKDIDKFTDLFTSDIFEPLYKINIINLIMRKNLKKLLSNPKLFTFTSLAKINYHKYNMKKFIYMNINIVKYILNHAEEEIYSSMEFIQNSFLFQYLASSLFCLNDIHNQKASIFIVNKIQKKFKEINTNVNLFLELIKRQVNNNYVFDYLFSSFKEKELRLLFKKNKNAIVISLYNYSQINAYKYIEIIINKFIKFMPLNEVEGIICPKYGKEDSFINIIITSLFNSKNGKQDDKDNKDELTLNTFNNNTNNEDKLSKYLLFYALLNPIIPNYEIIAILLENCKFEYALYNLISFFTDDFQNFYNIKIMKLIAYVSNKLNKNRIKNIGNNFYMIIEFFEKITRALRFSYEGLSEKEKKIFYYYIIIINFQITPKNLFRFSWINNEDHLNNDRIVEVIKNTINHLSEVELFIVLSLYELRGDPIISVKKYLPIFYSKIENMYYKFEKLDIPKINIGTYYDTQFYDNYVNIITKKDQYFLQCIPYLSHKNLSLIIQKEFSLDISEEKIDNYILNLIGKENIASFNKYHESLYLNIKQFYESKKEESNLYQLVIYSLLDFNDTSIYFINNNFMKKDKSDSKINTSLKIYSTYLEIIKEICHYVIGKKTDNFYYINYLEEYNITGVIEANLKKLKKNISLNIIKYIIKAYKTFVNKENVFFNPLIKWINDYIVIDVMKEYKRILKEKINIISFFKDLLFNCNNIIKVIEMFNKINDILKYSTISVGYLIINLDFQHCTDKLISNYNSGDSLFDLVNDILEKRTIDKNKKIEVKYKVFFNFDSKKMSFNYNIFH